MSEVGVHACSSNSESAHCVHSRQRRSDVTVGGRSSVCSPAAHVVSTLHCVLEVGVAAATWYSSSGLHGVTNKQRTSEVGVAAADSNSSTLQMVTGEHADDTRGRGCECGDDAR